MSYKLHFKVSSGNIYVILIIMLISLTYLTALSVACNTTVCEFPSLHVSAYYCQCRLSMKVSWFLQLSPAVNNALLGSGDQDPSLLTSNRARWLSAQLADQQSRLKICSSSLLLQETCMSAALQNAAIQTNGEDTDNDYCIRWLCWHWSITSGIRQQISVTCNL